MHKAADKAKMAEKENEVLYHAVILSRRNES